MRGGHVLLFPLRHFRVNLLQSIAMHRLLVRKATNLLSASPVLLMHCDQHDVHVHVHNDYFEAAGHNVTGHGEEARGQARLSI